MTSVDQAQLLIREPPPLLKRSQKQKLMQIGGLSLSFAAGAEHNQISLREHQD